MCEDVVKVHKSFPVFYDKAWFLLYTGYIFCKKKKKKETYSHALKLQMSHYCIC